MSSIKALARRVTGRRAAAKGLAEARAIDIAPVRSVCLFLGPYRNLTTLTASVLFLHPHCQVLNHAGRSVFGNRQVDFLAHYDRETFDNFVRFAIHASAGGQRGSAGGSITHSHAFTGEYKTKEIFEATGTELVKSDIHALVWKESLATANHIRQHGTDLDSVLRSEPRLRFVQPVRHPIDAAQSTLAKGFAKRFEQLDDTATIEQVVDAVLDEYVWVFDLQARHPERVYVFFEHNFFEPESGRATLAELARFLELEPLDAWLEPATQAFEVKPRYDHPDDLVKYYREGVEARFGAHPEAAAQLLRFIGD